MSQLFEELKRRNVFRVAIAYLAVAWLILQAADIVLDNIAAPDWLMKAVMFFMVIGFPIAVIFAWAFEMTPEGIKKEAEVDRSASIVEDTGKKLNRVIMSVLATAVVFLLIDKFVLDDQPTVDDVTEQSVAVLPFVAMSRGPDDEYFADGLTEEILNSLTRVPQLLVTARTSAFHFKGQDLPIPEIAATLGVAHIVEGSVRREGQRLRITAQLIRAADGFHLWSENYDRDNENSFDVQTDIAEKIATVLGVVLDDEQLEKMHAAGLRDPAAFVAFQKGVEAYSRAHGDLGDTQLEVLATANGWFEDVLNIAPNFSPAHRLHSDLYAHLLQNAAYGEDISAAEQDRAVQQLMADLNNGIRSATSPSRRLAITYDKALFAGQWNSLTAIVDEIASLEECSEPGWMDITAVPFGQARDYLAISEREIKCDPLSYGGWRSAADSHLWLGDPDAAIQVATEGSEKTSHETMLNTLFSATLSAGRFDEAESLIVLSGSADGNMAIWRLTLAAARGDAKQTERLLADYVDYPDNEYLTMAAAIAGNRELANQTAAAIDSRRYGYLWLMQMPGECYCGAPFDLGVTPNFKQLVEDANLAWPPDSPINWPLKDW